MVLFVDDVSYAELTRGLVKLWVFIPNSFQILITCQSY